MSVEGTKVADVHTVEDVPLLGNGTLDGIRKALDALLAVVVHHALAVQPTGGAELDGVIRLVGVQSQQILFHATYGTVNRHVVVVEDNQQVVGA